MLVSGLGSLVFDSCRYSSLHSIIRTVPGSAKNKEQRPKTIYLLFFLQGLASAPSSRMRLKPHYEICVINRCYGFGLFSANPFASTSSGRPASAIFHCSKNRA